jgi:ABC-type antimicrobial peptide transport system permease subunit
MSGAKETPRQKMIGMMYLVLTALLALNVSVEVLDAFTTVNDGLENTYTSVDKKISDYLNYAYLVQVTSILNYIFYPYIKDYVEHYKFKVDENEQNNLKVKSIFKFNVGIILINMWIIKRRYRHV